MRRSATIFAGIVGSLVFAATAVACLWDSDTLQMERLRFPGVLEIITGKFVRHSKDYYEWRIPDRLKKLEAAPDDPALIDDLAVAYDKLGRPEEGIVLLERVLEKHPDRYETLSNLATLLFHAGKLEESKEYVKRALEINPNAHFGREKYQLLLTEYVLQSELKTAGVMSTAERYTDQSEGEAFTGFVLTARFGQPGPPDDNEKYREWKQQSIEEIQAATKGVLGMMHFADYRSPVLLEALGDLLMHGDRDDNVTQLAARAYSRAAEFSDEKAAKQFRAMAESAIRMRQDFRTASRDTDLSKLQKQLDGEVLAAEEWYARIEADEQRWIAEGRDVDHEFAAAYYESLERIVRDAKSEAQVEVNSQQQQRRLIQIQTISMLGLLCFGIPAAGFAAVVYWIRARRNIKNEH